MPGSYPPSGGSYPGSAGGYPSSGSGPQAGSNTSMGLGGDQSVYRPGSTLPSSGTTPPSSPAGNTYPSVPRRQRELLSERQLELVSEQLSAIHLVSAGDDGRGDRIRQRLGGSLRGR